MRWRVAAGAVVVLMGAAFFAGYVPERRQRTAAEQQAVSLRQQLGAAEARVRMGRLLGRVLAVKDVVARQNYGQAQELPSAFFDEVRNEAAATPSGEFRSVLDQVLSRRDVMTAALAKAEPGILETLRTIEMQIRRALGYPVPDEAPST